MSGCGGLAVEVARRPQAQTVERDFYRQEGLISASNAPYALAFIRTIAGTSDAPKLQTDIKDQALRLVAKLAW
jgi:hypothetical protein